MPIYAYQCRECRHEVEVLQKISDAPLVDCPACHRSSLAKKVTAAGFQLKGSGWYVTDFRGNGSARPKEAPTDGASKEGGAASEAGKPADTPAAGSKPAADATPAAPTAPAGGSGNGPAPAS